MAKNDNRFDMNDYYDAEYIDEFEGYEDEESYMDDELEDNSNNDLECKLFFKNFREPFYIAILNNNIIFDNYEIKKKL